MYRETATKTPAATPHDMGLSLIKVVGEVYFPSPRIRACPCPPPQTVRIRECHWLGPRTQISGGSSFRGAPREASQEDRRSGLAS